MEWRRIARADRTSDELKQSLCAISLVMSCRHRVSHFHKMRSAYLTGFWSLITVLFLNNVPAHAKWMALEKGYPLLGLQTVFIDPDTIQREGNLVTVWQLTDFKWMQGSARGPARFLSTMTHKQIDCREKLVRLLAYKEFSLQMGTGIRVDGYVDKEHWLPIEPESINYALWQLACGQE